ncbi:MAG: exo-alpha-sialidase [Anaerolineales bacterium]|nr:exo-alpha-sialidase [Anaerolineales bacterium]
MRTIFRMFTVILAFLCLTYSPGSFLPTQASTLLTPRCNLLDDPGIRGIMSAAFERKLMMVCGQLSVEESAFLTDSVPLMTTILGTDQLVNDPTTDIGNSTTQNGTSFSINQETGTICTAYNDSQHWANGAIGFAGFSRSTNGGESFTDRGAVPAGGGGNGFGYPGMVWRAQDGYFYLVMLHTNGLGLWRSADECQNFTFYHMVHTGGGDDREMMAVDNNPASDYYGRLYVAWTDFNASSHIYVSYSDNGIGWSTPVDVSTHDLVQAAWPAVGPDGEVYLAWLHWDAYPNGPIDIEVSYSTDGGSTWTQRTNPLDNAVNPRDVVATTICGRPALNGNIRHISAPQIAVGLDGCTHVVYAYDPDGYNNGDTVNVYYRRSCDFGMNWGPEIQLNDDATTTDQWFPTLSAGSSNIISTAWYDRRLDPDNNIMFDYYQRVSYTGGESWQPSHRISDVSSPLPPLSPNFDPIVSNCWHGDYDQQTQYNNQIYLNWSDERNTQNGHPDPDVYFDTQPILGLELPSNNLHITVPLHGSKSIPFTIQNLSQEIVSTVIREKTPGISAPLSLPVNKFVPQQGHTPPLVSSTSVGSIPGDTLELNSPFPIFNPMALLPEHMAFSLEPMTDFYITFDLLAPETLINKKPFVEYGFPGAGEYVNGYLYYTDSTHLYQLDPVTGAVIRINPITAPPTYFVYTGMAFDSTTGLVYLSDSDISISHLYILDLLTGTTTLIGEIVNSPCTIALAIDGDGTLYGYDIFNDEFLTIDKSTAAGTVLGPLGFDANYGQGMAWDAATDTLYMAAFNGTLFQPELRIVDRATGSSSVVGIIGQDVPGVTTQIPFLGLPGFTEVDWLSVFPPSEAILAESAATFTLTFDANAPSISGIGDYQAELWLLDSLSFGETKILVTITVVPNQIYLPLIHR